jgi:hypothetical protein
MPRKGLYANIHAKRKRIKAGSGETMRKPGAKKSGKPSTQGSKATGERYLPEKAIKSLSSKEYAATTKKKRQDTKAGKQHSAQPKKIAKKTKRSRSR